MLKHLFVVSLFIAVPASQAQVRVVESSPQSIRSGVAQPIDTVNAETKAYFELQALKEEVSLLRGMVEEQAHELSRLKQQQMDNYLDLDKRLGAMPQRAADNSFGNSPDASLPPAATANVTASDGLGEAEVYSAAYELLKQRQIDSAVIAFKDHLSRFPQGSYTGNSFYWLGEIYLLKNDLPQSRDWFTKLLENFPNDRKVPDAQFKLGKVYHLLGDSVRAKALLTDVAAGSGDSARLAKQYLQENF